MNKSYYTKISFLNANTFSYKNNLIPLNIIRPSRKNNQDTKTVLSSKEKFIER